MQNGDIGRFNGKFRDNKYLKEHWFESLNEARRAAVAWRQEYNRVRAHSSLGRIPPAQFAEGRSA
jgi:putative transposase